jgi:hypothetical protein
MEARAQIPVSLPRSSPTTSYWQDPPDAEVADYMSAASLPGEVVDTVIVGSGITSAGVAWGLLSNETREQHSGRVVMLEARQACSGATGRNGISLSLLDESMSEADGRDRRPHKSSILPILPLHRPLALSIHRNTDRAPRIRQHQSRPCLRTRAQHPL